MNLLIVKKSELVSESTVLISGRRVAHLNEILDSSAGSELKVGLLGGKRGRGIIKKIDSESAEIELDLTDDPPEKLPLTVIIGLCRPKVLSRLISDLTSYGVQHIEIVKTFFGDKGYWTNELFTPEGLFEAVVKGLEQSMDTIEPSVTLVKRFGPYSEDVLPNYSINSKCYIANPGAVEKLGDIAVSTPGCIAVGPERGFTKYEVNQFVKAGFKPVSLGERIIRTEAAVHVCVSKFL
ncbi:RNA methyltransferase [bacterium]|nr:RNA methyltransferase [bacterium]